MRNSVLAAVMIAAFWAQPALAAPANVRASVAATAARTADNVKLDAGRKPAELLAFLGLEKGMRVADMFGANLYWAEIIAPAIGPKGRLLIWQPGQFMNDKRAAAFADFAARQKNVALVSSPFATPILAPKSVDFMLINLDYHDVYWESAERKIPRMEPNLWLKTIFAAIRPGGVVGIVDHQASAGGETRAVVEKMHRIDPAVVKADFERAGFVLEAQSELLRNPADDHSLNVFDAKIRGKTDRFAFRFRKPR